MYENGSLIYILTSEGRVVANSGNYSYEYFLKDHLGNTRVTMDQNGDIAQVADYYPFGMRHEPFAIEQAGQKYLYNGKELQDETGWYDYGARFYSGPEGRWHVIDNKAEKYYSVSPYAYALNNPVRYIDPDGNVIVDATGNVIYTQQGGWSKNASVGAMKIGNAMMNTPVGREQFNKLSNASYNITLTLDSGTNGSKMGQARTTATVDANGKTKIEQVDITVYEGKIKETFKKVSDAQEKISQGATMNNPTDKQKALVENVQSVDEIIGAVGTHEAEHATNKDANGAFETDKSKREALADKKEIEYLEQVPEYRLKTLEPIPAQVVIE